MLNLFLLCSFFQISWETLKVEDGKFEITTPGELTLTQQQIETDVGLVDYYTYHRNFGDEDQGHFIFIVSYYHLKNVPDLQDDPGFFHEFLDATVKESSLSVGGEVIFEDKITLKGTYPGRFWRMHYNGGESVMKSKAYIANNIFYSLQVAVDKQHGLSPHIDRFFDSFRLLESESDTSH